MCHILIHPQITEIWELYYILFLKQEIKIWSQQFKIDPAEDEKHLIHYTRANMYTIWLTIGNKP